MNIQTITLNNSYLLISLKEFLTRPWRGEKNKQSHLQEKKNKDKYYIKNILMIKKNTT